MSTQIRFDLEGLRRAIEVGDSQYQLALYDDAAEISIVDEDDPGSAPCVLQGKAAIASWIHDVQDQTCARRVLNPEVGVDRLTLIEEFQTSDGSNFRYACTADVHSGRITRQTVVKEQPLTGYRPATPLPGPFLG